MLTESCMVRARHRASWLASVCFLLACGAPQEPTVRPGKAGPLPTPVIRIPGESSLSLKIGAGVQLSVVMEDSRGVEVPVPGAWSSSDTAVARVDSSGGVMAVGYGEATISAFYGGALAKVMVSTYPSGFRLRQQPEGVALEEGDATVVVAEFLDANGEVIVGRWDVRWEVSSGARMEPGGVMQTQLLRGLPAGETGVIATSGPFRASLRFAVRRRGEPKLTVPHFTMWARSLPNGLMEFYPDLIVSAPFEATIERLEFNRPVKSLCTSATVAPEVETPLFDFIPYDVGWRDGAVDPGSVVEAIITYRRSDGSIQATRVPGLVTTWGGGVVDYGGGTVRWSVC